MRSAWSSVNPSAKTASRANSRCSSGVSSAWLHSMTPRRVRCRGRAARVPPREDQADGHADHERLAQRVAEVLRRPERRLVDAPAPVVGRREVDRAVQ